ncbi:MAG: adenylosuccinate lyase, partial [Nitrososphaerota archaeon]
MSEWSSAGGAVSPIDGRYREMTRELSLYFSEDALIRYRLRVEAEYLRLVLGRVAPQLVEKASAVLDEAVSEASSSVVEEVKKIEAETRHDVEAVVRFLKKRLEERGFAEAARLVHIGLTS